MTTHLTLSNLPDDVVKHNIMSFLEPGPENDEALATLGARFQESPVMRDAGNLAQRRLDAQRATLLQGSHFDKKYGKTFDKNGHPLESLPVLTLPARSPDYIKVHPEQMRHPVEIFKDERNRTGFAIKIRSKSDETIKVITIHERAPNGFYVYSITGEVLPEDTETGPYTDSPESDLARKYHATHGGDGARISLFTPECQQCPFHNPKYMRIDPSFLDRLLKGADPAVELVGDLPEKIPVKSCSDVVCNLAFTVLGIAVAYGASYMLGIF